MNTEHAYCVGKTLLPASITTAMAEGFLVVNSLGKMQTLQFRNVKQDILPNTDKQLRKTMLPQLLQGNFQLTGSHELKLPVGMMQKRCPVNENFTLLVIQTET